MQAKCQALAQGNYLVVQRLGSLYPLGRLRRWLLLLLLLLAELLHEGQHGAVRHSSA